MAIGEGRRRLGRRAVTVGVLAGLVAGVTRVVSQPAPGGPLNVPADDGAPVGLSAAGLPSPSGQPSGQPSDPSPATSPAARELPRGGRTLFPRYRLVGYCGSPGSPALGRLGIGSLDDRIRELEGFAGQYSAAAQRFGATVVTGALPVRQVLPVLELIAVVVQRYPGEDGTYRVRVAPDVVEQYLAAARRHRALLLLNIQPGRAAFLDEVRAFERWLREPDVGVALDPEWAVRAPLVPGQVFGHATGPQLDAVAAYLADLVAANELPEKVMVVHQLSRSVLRDMGGFRAHPGVVAVKSVDGIGTPAQKLATWRDLVSELPGGMRPGFKLFFEEDTSSGAALMTPAEVLALTPTPDYVLYE